MPTSGHLDLTKDGEPVDQKVVTSSSSAVCDCGGRTMRSSSGSEPPPSVVSLGDFVGPASRHIVSLGGMRMGDKCGDIPRGTQFLLVESKAGAGEEEVSYVVFLPLVEGVFRASLQGGGAGGDKFQLCVESGDAGTLASSFYRVLFVGAAESDPFAAIAGTVAAVCLGNLPPAREKKLPGIVDSFSGDDPATATGIETLAVHRFYDELHTYTAVAGVDGVKVDVQCILKMLGTGHGGRVQLTKEYHRALNASVAKNFPDNGIIASMSHNTDALY
ncbi:hypothetical protein TRIUR3_31778 [Triticum urartu]|uniref:Uncharacterized protein n=1 Tax=Triticum urartu TaxID=4572 RepID=M7YEL0_TRIUA|nr:hypothetical protein TRIUR3_31778 [Triticum urartu]